MILAAGGLPEEEKSTALANLCSRYWLPLYWYARRKTFAIDAAQDLTQAFFAHLMEKDLLAVATPERGRFRSFLLTAFRNFMINEWEKQKAKKRIIDLPFPLDFANADPRLSNDLIDNRSPENIYERDWAQTLLDQVVERLRCEYIRAGKKDIFNHLQCFLAGPNPLKPYSEAAQKLGMSDSGVKVAVHRMRNRYRTLLREEIAQTVATSADVEDEINHLFAVFRPK